VQGKEEQSIGPAQARDARRAPDLGPPESEFEAEENRKFIGAPGKETSSITVGEGVAPVNLCTNVTDTPSSLLPFYAFHIYCSIVSVLCLSFVLLFLSIYLYLVHVYLKVLPLPPSHHWAGDRCLQVTAGEG
jgi:hypothetical protein